MTRIIKHLTSDRGAVATEYALMVGLIALVIAGTVALFGQAVVRLFDIPPVF
jgi:Flp pilus assembly pilin Flp